MPYDSRTYRVLIASPGDVEEEREIAVRVIQEWNDLHSAVRKVVLLPLRWETHTTPTYGKRPQEVVNRAIVDDCDLLLGIFWSRIGTPTGVADSGTLEEIERVATAGKQVMLYFSNIGIDPDSIDLKQIERLMEFKAKTYPNALVEKYRSHIDFRDKLSRQLERKVRELQQEDKKDSAAPLSLDFASPLNGDLIGKEYSVVVPVSELSDLDQHLSNLGRKPSRRLQERIENALLIQKTVPMLLAVSNKSSSGVQSIFAQLNLRVVSGNAKTSASAPRKYEDSSWPYLLNLTDWSATPRQLPARFDGSFQKSADGWTFSFEWQAIQPQRTRFVSPLIYVTPDSDCEIEFNAQFYADNFPQPEVLTAKLRIQLEKTTATTLEAFPTLDQMIEDAKKEPDKAPIHKWPINLL